MGLALTRNRHMPRGQTEWALLVCRISGVVFTLQGLLLIGLYAARGFDTPPEAMPPGLQLDPRHAVLHLAIGLVGAFVGFRRPSEALVFVRMLAGLYLGLAFLGTFTPYHFGMQLAFEENTFHLVVGTLMAVIGVGPQLRLLFVRRQVLS